MPHTQCTHMLSLCHRPRSPLPLLLFPPPTSLTCKPPRPLLSFTANLSHLPLPPLQVKVKKRGDDEKFLARVLALGVDCDIALLTVDDPAFWEGLAPLEFGPLPQLQDTVAVVGYPIGGDTISVTAGVVSRIEVGGWV